MLDSVYYSNRTLAKCLISAFHEKYSPNYAIRLPMNMIPAVLLAIGLSANAEGSCPHDFALYCPAPEAPRVTELREGSVRLIYKVKLTGSVRNIVVAEYTGDARWQASVIEAVAKWRYAPPKEVYEQSYFFTAEFAE